MKNEIFPWEDRRNLGFFQALGSSVQALILSPVQSFSRISPDPAFTEPFLFGIICLSIGSVANHIWTFVARSLFGPLIQARVQEWLSQALGQNIPETPHTGPVGSFLQLVFGIVFAPLVVGLAVLVSTSVYHLALIIIRAPRKTFETTLAAVCYGSGSAALLTLVPILGGIAAGILGLIYTAMGIKELHGTTGGQAALVVLLPLFFCCCLFVAAIFAAFSFGLFAAALAHKS